jgi:hypothetical protein
VDQDYLGVNKSYYRPVDRGVESEIKRRLENLRAGRLRDSASDKSSSLDQDAK